MGAPPGPSPTVNMGKKPQTLSIWCVAGHTWELEVGTRGLVCCPMHAKFFKGHFPPSLKPPARVVREWEDAQENLVNDDQYKTRWASAWRRIVRVVSSRQMSWSVDLGLIEEYVRHLRFAELHRLYAQDEPYVANSSGTLREHPGWKMAEREEREARRCAEQLGVEGPDQNYRGSRNRSKGEEAKKSQRHQQTSLEQRVESDHPDGIVDSTVGPDGEPL